MSDNSAYRKILRLIGRVRDCCNNNNNEEPEDEYGSVPEHLRGKTFEFLQSRSPYQRKIHFLLFQFVAPGRLERNDRYLIDRGAYLFQDLVKYTHGKNNSFRIFSLKEIQKATNNFSADMLLSNWTWGNFHTYRGIIEDRHVAVKIFVFTNEVVSLSLIKHRNVAKLLGCCLETSHVILVHEFPSNGTLEGYIFPKKLIPPPVELLWTDRLRIATEIADAVAYLHSELHMTHGRLKAAQAVLLDEFHSAKLGAFDLSQIQNQAESSNVQTDIRNNFRKCNDVYQFGKILLNLLGIDSGKVRCYDKVDILKYLKLNVSEKEMPQIEAYIHLFLRCPWHEQRWNIYYERMKEVVGENELSMKEVVGENELSMKEVVRELRCIRSTMNPQPTTDGNESDNLSSGAN